MPNLRELCMYCVAFKYPNDDSFYIGLKDGSSCLHKYLRKKVKVNDSFAVVTRTQKGTT